MIAISHGCRTDKGKVREENQDTYGLTPPAYDDLNAPKGVLFVVADGMGGHRAGALASALAVTTLTSSYASATGTAVPELISSSFRQANAHIYAQASSDPMLHGMGTTCTALVFQGSSCWIGHIGDSKIFLASAAEIRQVTTDHSLVGELLRRGVITPEQARVHPERNLLTRALGMQVDAAMEVSGPLPLSPATWFVMCTDGLTNHLEEEEIRRMVVGRTPQVAADELVDLANARGGTDNVTVVIVQVGAETDLSVNRT